MTFRLLRLFVFILLCGVAAAARAQEPSFPVLDALDSSFTQYSAAHQPPELFLHIDKTVYVRQENIWFTAYILSQDTIAQQHTLYTLLVEEATRKVVAADRFIIEAGQGQGSIFLPDSLPTGEYRLLAYTNSYFTHPRQAVFQQAISLKAPDNTTFRLSLVPPARSVLTEDSVHFAYKVLTGYGGLAGGGECSYTLLVDRRSLQSGRKKINPFGEISFSLPRQQVLNKRLQLEATITREKDKQLIKTAVPLFQDIAFIKLYPESGNLVHDQPSSTAIEIKNGYGTPIATRGKVLANGQPVASFQTDLYGTGIILWQPQQALTYTLQLDDPALQLVYTMPPVAATGYSLHLQQAVITDTSFVVEMGTPGASSCHLVAHNYRTAYFAGKLKTYKEKATLRLSTADMPEGVTTLTLFDSTGVPRAERAVYIQKKGGLRVQLITDSPVYHRRAKLALKVKVTNQEGKPVRSLFSLACVLASRIDTTRAADIVRFQHFDRFLPAPANLPGQEFFSNTKNIEQLLLTRFWTRYKWEEIQAALPYTAPAEKRCDVGHVFYKERPAKKPVTLMIISGKGTFTLDTDSSGYFELPSQALQVEAGKKVIILVSDTKNFKDYRVKLHNACNLVDTALSQTAWPEAGYSKAELTVEEQAHLKKALQAVVVTAKKTPDNFSPGTFRSSTCHDWVCMYNILNCLNHPTGAVPVNGGQYTYRGHLVTYVACQSEEAPPGFMQQVNGSTYPKEFYVADYEKFNPTVPEIMSTVFWAYKVLTDENGEATLRFFTNDLSGKFTCVLQGYSGEGVISGKTFFRVAE